MAEVTMICVDNSGFMCPSEGGAGLMKAQTDAIELYLSAKLEAHPDNLVGFTTIGRLSLYCKPTRDPKFFWSTFERLEVGGPLKLINCLEFANFGLYSNPLLNKRLVMFVGGQLHCGTFHLEHVATLIREAKIAAAVDVVNFGMQDHDFSGRKDMLLQAFVALVDNGRYLYAPTGSNNPLTKNLSSSPIMPRLVTADAASSSSSSSSEEDDIQPLGMNKNKHKRKHRNRSRNKHINNKPLVQPLNGITVPELVMSH